jgi:hypothetical protein
MIIGRAAVPTDAAQLNAPSWRVRYCIQVSEYLVDHRRIFATGDDANITTVITAG